MKVVLSWLSDFMEINHSVDEYIDMLNQLGLEVEGVEQPGKEITGVVVVKVLSVEPHPNADKLRLVDIDMGSEKRKVVCGAPNVREGLLVAYAPSGATLPGGFTLSKKEIRGVESDGMLCSGKELGIGEDHSGIYELGEDAQIGQNAVEYLGLDDTIIELSITPNRPDAMSMVGVARELCAAFNQELKLPNFDSLLEGIEIDESLPAPEVEVQDEEKCPRFVGRTLSVEIGQSPSWMQSRLTKAGMRPINNVVDVTNYVLLEWGRPLHAFDVSKIGDAKLIARRAKEGEIIKTLDEQDRKLIDQDLVIADSKNHPQAIAGVMGGYNSEVDETTKQIYLESAYFQPSSISRTSKRLGLRSEASARFERGIDPDFTSYGADRACQLFSQVCNAKISKEKVDHYPTKIEPKVLELRTSRVKKILGDHIPTEQIVKFLEPLVERIEITDQGVKVWAPTFRPDLEREIDLIEEVARRRGLNSFEPTLPNSIIQVGGLNPKQKKRRIVEDALCGAGLMEAYTMPLESEDLYVQAGYSPEELVRTKNALKADASILRPILLPGLVKSVKKNIARGISNVSLFEVGTVFNKPFDENLQPKEELFCAFVLSGQVDNRPLQQPRDVDVFDAIDLLNTVTDSLALPRAELKETIDGKLFHPTRSTFAFVDEKPVAVVGQILEDFNIVGCGINLDMLFSIEAKDKEYVPQSHLPHVNFDLSLVVDRSVPAQQLELTLKSAGGNELEYVKLFDVYEGETLGADKKALGFNLRVRPQTKTWNEDDLSSYRTTLLDALKEQCGAVLR